MSAREQPDRRQSVRERRESCPGWIEEAGGRRGVTLVDVSELGAGMLCESPMGIGEDVILKVGLGPLRVPRRARVVRCNPREGGGFVVGIEFTDVRVQARRSA
jgi:hypothetical protein